MKLTYHRCGDYLLPDLGLTEEEQQPLGKYGMMRMNYLKEHRPILFNRLLLTGKLMEHLHEIDRTANERLDHMIPLMKEQEGVTEQLKAVDQLGWVARMNSIKHRVEETIMDELIYA